MSDTGIHSNEIHQHGAETIGNARLAEAYRSSTVRLFTHRLTAIAEVPGFERLRDTGREIKRHTIENLDFYLNQFADSVERNGGKMHWASTAADVCRIVVDIVKQLGGAGSGEGQDHGGRGSGAEPRAGGGGDSPH